MNNRLAINKMRSRLPVGSLALVFSVLLLLLIYQLWLNYRDHVKTAEINTSNFAAVFEARIDATLRRADAELMALAISFPLAALNAKEVNKYEQEINGKLDAQLFNMDEMGGYQVYDANGDVLYSSQRLNARRVNIADQGYFRQLSNDSGEDLVFSDVFVEQRGLQVIVLARALRDGNGHFKGVVCGLIDLDHYRKQFQSLELGTQGVIALRRSDNHAQIVRWPDELGGANQKLAPDHPVVLRMVSGGKRVLLHYEVNPENIRRIMTIQRMQKYPFYVAVGAGLDDVLSGWRKQAMAVAISIFLLFAIIGTLLYRLVKMRVREAGILSNLAQSESQFRDLARMVPVGICHFDANGKYTYVNDRYMAITGRAREELMRGWWWSYIHSDDRVVMQEAWWDSGSRAEPFVSEYRFVCPNGRWAFVLGEVQAEIEPASGRVLGFIAALTDITGRKQTEAELRVARQQAETANIAKTRFLAAASHDLRQPIQAINLFQDALERTDLNAEQKTISGFLSKSVHALGDLLHALLDVSRLDAGQVKPQFKVIQVENFFKAIDAEFSSLARQKNLRFKLFYPFNDVHVVTDPDLMMRVLRNLIDNALKYTEKGGVLVAFRIRNGYGAIQVWDTGIGIESHYGERVFDECFQVGNAARDRARGIGLGLSIVRRTARLLNADVHYHSKFGRGSMFEIFWPLTASDSGFALHEAVSTRPLSLDCEKEKFARFLGSRVVVIEDDPVVAKSIELALGAHGIVVNSFSSAEQALSGPEVLGADFYITDFNLPGLNGLELLAAIEQRSGGFIRAVVVTGETSPERIELNSSSPWKVLFKPVGLPDLLSAMDGEINEGVR